MAAQAHDTGTTSRPPRRADAGTNQLGQRRADTGTTSRPPRRADADTNQLGQRRADAGTNQLGQRSADAGTNQLGQRSADADTNRLDQRSAEAGTNQFGQRSADAGTNRLGQRRADAGTNRLSQRDIDGLLLTGEHYGAPYDLLADALRVQPDRLPKIMGRWRRTGYAATGRLGPGPGWCWLTRDGMAATGLGFPAIRPALGRLAHIRAVLAARLWLEASPAWQHGQAWWHSERRLRADHPAAGRNDHVPDAEIHWPSIAASPYAGQVWAIEVELTPKPVTRTIRIMTGLLSPLRYAQVVYLTAPAARPVVTRAVASLPPGEQVRIAVRDLPAAAFPPEPPR